MRDYATIKGVSVEEVVEWVSAYVNGPWADWLIPYIEDTEEQRLEFIKGYIRDEIANSTTGRIRAINQLKEAA